MLAAPMGATQMAETATTATLSGLRAWSGDAPVAEIGFGRARRKTADRSCRYAEFVSGG